MRTIRRGLGVFRYTWRAVELVWTTNPGLTVALALLTGIAGLLPAVIAIVGKLIIDGVVLAAQTGLPADRDDAVFWMAVEAGLVIAMAGAQKGLEVCQWLLRAQLGHRTNVLILEKALELDLVHFEDPELYDRMTQARREASSRPLSLARRSFGLFQNSLALVTYGAILLSFSPWAVAILAVAAVPAFVAETTFAGEAFRLFRWRTPEKRKQAYLEVVVAREDYAKEVKLMGIGPMLVERYKAIFETLYGEDRNLTLRRGAWGFGLGLLSILALYGAYGWILLATVASLITLGDMTMYLMVFKQGQAAFSANLQAVGGMYEDNLYLSNLYEFLETEVPARQGTATSGTKPGDGIRFESVSFTYPGADVPAISELDLHLPPGRKLALVGHNGSGKTTLIKLLAGLYEPSAGRIRLDGRDLREWDTDTLHDHIGVIFQDFVRYQMTVGENVGVGDVDFLEDDGRRREASEKGMAMPFIDEMPDKFQTQLGRWFKDGRELSLGQWQKVALSRAFMRKDAQILVLDEPTAAMDAEAEAQIFQRFRDMTAEQMAILISHRFSTVRMADHIAVLDHGKLIEEGTHQQLMQVEGQYAKLFTLQAQGYL